MPLTTSQSPLRVLVVMDPIDEIKPAKDTTLAMLLAAQKRGWELWYAEQRDLWLRDGIPLGFSERGSTTRSSFANRKALIEARFQCWACCGSQSRAPEKRR